MKQSAIRETFSSGARVLDSMAASKEAVADALQEGKNTMAAFVKRSRHAVEDWVDETTHNIKRFPIRSVVVAFSVGALFGVLISRNGRS